MQANAASPPYALVYPTRPEVVIGSLEFGSLALGSAWLFVIVVGDILRDDFDRGTVLAGLFFGLIAVAFGFMASFDVRQLVRRRPLLRLDGLGFECREGRVDWADVERVSADEHTLTMRLRLDAEPRAGATGYHDSVVSGEVGRWRTPWFDDESPTMAHGICVATGRKSHRLEAVRTFYKGEIGEPLPGEGRPPGGIGTI